MKSNVDHSMKEDLQNHLRRYIAICNDIMEANEKRFPFVQIWQALEDELGGRPIEYSVRRGQCLAEISAIFIDRKMRLITWPAHNKAQIIPKIIEWSYMQEVLANPTRYIANPTLVDWDLVVDKRLLQVGGNSQGKY